MPSVGSSSTSSLRPGDQRAADGELLLLAAGEVAAAPAQHGLAAPGTARTPRRGSCARRAAGGRSRSRGSPPRSAAGRSRGPAARRRCRAARARRRACGVMSWPSNRILPRADRLVADDGAQQRGLADAVAAEHAGDLAELGGDRDAGAAPARRRSRDRCSRLSACSTSPTCHPGRGASAREPGPRAAALRHDLPPWVPDGSLRADSGMTPSHRPR